jgi:hypothetical protein
MMALLQNAGGFDLVVGINVGGTEREREQHGAEDPESGLRSERSRTQCFGRIYSTALAAAARYY